MLLKQDPFQEIEQILTWWSTQPFRRPLWDDRNEHTWSPAVNVYEDMETLYLETQLPGIDMKDVTVTVADDILNIRGERSTNHAEKKDGYYVREAPDRTFTRNFHLPKSVNPNEAKAIYDKGVLIIKVPKQEESKPKLIPIESNEPLGC